MKAAIYNRYGGPEVLGVEEVAKPEPGDDELLIETRAAEVTKADCEMRRFRFPVKWFWLPLRFAAGLRKPRRTILGGYFAGVVVATGRDVRRFRPGDAIFGATRLRFGAHGEFLCLPEHYTLEKKPPNISFEQAAAVPLGGLNAIHFMRKAGLQPGESILINGAGGSIGSFAVQLAKRIGAHVTAVDHGTKAAMLRDLGADRVVDYTREDFTRQQQTYDVIFDMVVGSSYSGCIGRLRPGGRYLKGNPRIADMLRSMVTPWISDKRVYFEFAGEKQEELHQLAQLLEAGEIHPAVDRVYPLEQIADAHRRVETEERLGIVVVSMTDPSDDDAIAAAVRRWVETVVVDLNLCPFAERELRQTRIRFTVSPAITEAQLLASLQTELEWLDSHPGTETTLLIHPRVLQDFGDYNQFLESADERLNAMGVDGIYQIASFHPHYQFAGTDAAAVENCTNRSPYPLLHLLREETLARCIASYPDIEQIPLRNIALMKRLGTARLKALWQACFT